MGPKKINVTQLVKPRIASSAATRRESLRTGAKPRGVTTPLTLRRRPVVRPDNDASVTVEDVDDDEEDTEIVLEESSEREQNDGGEDHRPGERIQDTFEADHLGVSYQQTPRKQKHQSENTQSEKHQSENNQSEKLPATSETADLEAGPTRGGRMSAPSVTESARTIRDIHGETGHLVATSGSHANISETEEETADPAGEIHTLGRGAARRRSTGRAAIARGSGSSSSSSSERESAGEERRRRRQEREEASQQRQEELDRMHQVLMALAKDAVDRKLDTDKQFRQVSEQQKSTMRALESFNSQMTTMREEQAAVKGEIQLWLSQMFTQQGRGQAQLPWHGDESQWAGSTVGEDASAGQTVVANNHRHHTSKARSPVTFHCDTINATTMHLGPTNMAYTAALAPRQNQEKENRQPFTIPVALGTPVEKNRPVEVVVSQARMESEKAIMQQVQPLVVAHTHKVERMEPSGNKVGASVDVKDQRGHPPPVASKVEELEEYEKERAVMLRRARVVFGEEEAVRAFMETWDINNRPVLHVETSVAESRLVHDLTSDGNESTETERDEEEDTDFRSALSTPHPELPFSASARDQPTLPSEAPAEDSDASEHFNPQDKSNLGVTGKRKPPLKVKGRHGWTDTVTKEPWGHLPGELQVTFQAYSNYGSSRGGGYDEQEWLQALHTWTPTQEEVTILNLDAE